MTNGTSFPKWDKNEPNESLEEAYEWAIEHARSQIAWYQESRRPKKLGSQWFRGLAIALAAIGGLFPLVDAATQGSEMALGQWGYVVIALAAALVLYDRFFGLSSGWMRYMLTELSLQRTLREFQYDWNILVAQQTSPQNDPLPLLRRLKDFSLQVETLIKQETDAWVTEFRTNLSELETMLKTEMEARTPGSIKVTVTNARDFDRVGISLDGVKVKELVGDTEGVLDSVPRGPREVTAVGQKAGSPDRKDTKVVEAEPNTVVSTELTLPGP
jgi:SMODS and SLOG-associating 2TM effector domain 2